MGGVGGRLRSLLLCFLGIALDLLLLGGLVLLPGFLLLGGQGAFGAILGFLGGGLKLFLGLVEGLGCLV